MPGAWELPVAARYMALTQKVMRVEVGDGLGVSVLGGWDVGCKGLGVGGGAEDGRYSNGVRFAL